MFNTMKQAVTNKGLTSEDVTTYGLSMFGVVVVRCAHLQARMQERGYPMHTAFGRKFFFCFLTRCY